MVKQSVKAPGPLVLSCANPFWVGLFRNVLHWSSTTVSVLKKGSYYWKIYYVSSYEVASQPYPLDKGWSSRKYFKFWTDKSEQCDRLRILLLSKLRLSIFKNSSQDCIAYALRLNIIGYSYSSDEMVTNCTPWKNIYANYTCVTIRKIKSENGSFWINFVFLHVHDHDDLTFLLPLLQPSTRMMMRT